VFDSPAGSDKTDIVTEASEGVDHFPDVDAFGTVAECAVVIQDSERAIRSRCRRHHRRVVRAITS
jgi:hypothetical protein